VSKITSYLCTLMQKYLPRVGLLIFAFLHLCFVSISFFDQPIYSWPWMGLILIFVLITFSYFQLFTIKKQQWASFSEFIALVVSGVVTFYLNNNLEWGAVIASAVVGTGGGLLPYLNKKSTVLKTASPAIYCGTFVGMASTTLFDQVHYIYIASCIAALFFVFTKGLLNGYGGKLGTIAFSGVLATFYYW